MEELKFERINLQGKGGGETINLEKQFVRGLQNLGGTNLVNFYAFDLLFLSARY